MTDQGQTQEPEQETTRYLVEISRKLGVWETVDAILAPKRRTRAKVLEQAVREVAEVRKYAAEEEIGVRVIPDEVIYEESVGMKIPPPRDPVLHIGDRPVPDLVGAA